MKNKKIFIWKNKCWESRGSNLGDLAIITAMVNQIKKNLPDAEIIMLSDDPQYTSKLYGITSYSINIFNILRIIPKIDLFIIGGGTVFTDASSISIIPINTSLAIYARMWRKPIFCYAIGVGKMTRLGRSLVKRVLKGTKAVCVRDHGSAEVLEDMKIKKCPPIFMTEDAAFSLYNENVSKVKRDGIIISPRRIFHYKHSILPFYLRKKLGLLPKNYFEKMETFTKLLAELSDRLIKDNDCNVRFLPMYSGLGEAKGLSGYFKKKFSSRDDILCQSIIDKMKFKERTDIILSDKPQFILDEISKAELLIGIPLHSIIFSHVSGTPYLALNYQEKVERFMNHIELTENMINVNSMDSVLDIEEFYNKAKRILSNGEEISQILNEKSKKIIEVVNSPAEKIKQLIEDIHEK